MKHSDFRGYSDSDDGLTDDKYIRSKPRDGGRRHDGDFVEDIGKTSNPETRDGLGGFSKKNRSQTEDYEGGDLLRAKRRDREPGQRSSFDEDEGVAGGRVRRGAGEAGRRGQSIDEPVKSRPVRVKYDLAEPLRRNSRERFVVDEPEPSRRRGKTSDGQDNRRRRDARYDEDEVDARLQQRRDTRYDEDQEDARPIRRRDGDYDEDKDRGYRSDGPRSTRRKERDRGYGPDMGILRSSSQRDPKRNRDRRRDSSYSSRDRDRDRGWYDSERDSDRNRDRKKKGLSFSTKDIGRYYETGQKHYKTVKPIVESLAKMYMDSRK